ncbi:MAG: sugar phosphate nucleotidyltransferase [Gemmatimonadaceae bacterium]
MLLTHTAVILARGLGTRMKRSDGDVSLNAAQATAADAGAKGMISVGRPFLDYVISALADAGVKEVVLVIGAEHQAIREYFTSVAPPARVRVRFAEQDKPVGTADAVVAAATVVGIKPFLVLNADNYYPVAAYGALLALPHAGVVAFDRDALVRDGNISAERVRSFAILDVGADGNLAGIVEKPGAAIDLHTSAARWVGMNLWLITPALVDACRRVSLSTRGEFELPEAVALAVQEGVVVQVVKLEAGVLDLSQRSDIAAVATRLKAVEARP